MKKSRIVRIKNAVVSVTLAIALIVPQIVITDGAKVARAPED